MITDWLMSGWLLSLDAVLTVCLIWGIYRIGNRPLWCWRIFGIILFAVAAAGIFWLFSYADVQGGGAMIYFMVAGLPFPAIAFLIGQLAYIIIALGILNAVWKTDKVGE